MDKAVAELVEAWGILDIPSDLIAKMADKSLYFFIVSVATWKGGEPKRMRMHLEKAKRMAGLEGYRVSFDSDQEKAKGQRSNIENVLNGSHSSSPG